MLEFDHVVGKLRAFGRPLGFSLTADPVTAIFRVDLEDNRAILRTNTPQFLLEGASLYYGRGVDPCCNIKDSAGRPVPVMGPIQLGKPRAFMGFVRTLSVSKIFPSAGKLHTLEYPKEMSDLKLQTRTFSEDFCDLHDNLAATASQDALVYYACRIECPEAMKLRVWLGYDGPVKLWIDSEEKFHDPDGTNPAYAADTSIDFATAAGQHDVLIALGSNQGMACGILLSFERIDIPPAAISKGKYLMPTVKPI